LFKTTAKDAFVDKLMEKMRMEHTQALLHLELYLTYD